MTPNQIKNASMIDLLDFYKAKARCEHSREHAQSIFNEIETRLKTIDGGEKVLWPVKLGYYHMADHGEGTGEFDEACDTLKGQLIVAQVRACGAKSLVITDMIKQFKPIKT